MADFRFDLHAEPGRRFAPAWRQGSRRRYPYPPAPRKREGREGAPEAKCEGSE